MELLWALYKFFQIHNITPNRNKGLRSRTSNAIDCTGPPIMHRTLTETSGFVRSRTSNATKKRNGNLK